MSVRVSRWDWASDSLEQRSPSSPWAFPEIHGAIVSRLEVPRLSLIPSTVVRKVYPTADELPENLLKFDIQFSGSMSRGHVYEHIHLKNFKGDEVVLPFLELDEELWDSTGTRLTLFIDPGRIKRGVQPLEEVGPALESGKQYTLSIDQGLRDGSGCALKEAYEKTFAVGPPDRNPPDPLTWKILPPRRKSKDPLILEFSESMDHALSLRMLRVTDASGVLLEGVKETVEHERGWRFMPGKLWKRGSYLVQVQTAIEDLAGNNIGKPFDVDLFEGIPKKLESVSVPLRFEVR